MGKILERLRGKKSLVGNVGLSFIASMLSAIVLQLVIHPWLAKEYSESEYGDILFIVGVINVVILALGNALGDIRLTKNNSFASDEKQKDYNTILCLALIVGVVAVAVFLFVKGNVSFWIAVTLILFAILGIAHSYLVSILRMRLQFKDSLVGTVLQIVGYIIAIPIVMLTKLWPLIFCSAYMFSDVFLAIKTKCLKDGFGFTYHAPDVGKAYTQLSFSYILKSSLTYIDRFIVYPTLGDESVAIFTVSTVLGKCVALVLQPMANVALGYYAQRDYVMTRKKYWIFNAFTIAMGGVAFVFVALLSSLFIKLLYPAYIEAVAPYILIANLSSIIGALPSIIQPALLKFCGMRWQIIIQSVYAMVCVASSLLFIAQWGLLGFCYAMLLSNVIKLLLMVFIGDVGIGKVKRK